MKYDNLFEFKYNLSIISIKTAIVILLFFLILRIFEFLPRDYNIIVLISLLIILLSISHNIIIKHPKKLYIVQFVTFILLMSGLVFITILSKKIIVLLWLDFLIISAHIASTKKIAFSLFVIGLILEIILFLTEFKVCGLFNKVTLFFSLIFFNILGYLVSLQLEKFAYETEAQKILLEKVTMIDFLTDTYNRRAFFKLSNMMINEAIRENQNIGIIMMDIDFFKKINDTYGHLTGDIVLRDFAYTIKENIRSNDLFARIGGEEFILIIKNPQKNSLEIFAEKLLNAVRNKEIINENNKIRITVSMGLYIFNPKFETLESAMNKADKALYEAKRKRDNFVIYEDFQEVSQSA